MDVSDTVANKWAALGSHKTQFGTFHVLRRLPEDVANRFASREHFCIAWPEPALGTKLNDLFDGV
jgi:LmbE family N-acetylglucosaminyl deacetylase